MDETTQQLVQLLDSSGGRLHALLAKLTSNRDAAEELLQELFLRMMNSAGFAAAANQEAYAYRAVVNLAFDWRKRKPADGLPLLESDVAVMGDSPIDNMVQRETIANVLTAMQCLSQRDRELISLRYVQGESSEWIAERFDSTPHRIRSRCSKAMKRLRKLIGHDTTQLCEEKGERA